MRKRKPNNQTAIGVISSALLVLAHIAVIVIIFLSSRYFDIYPSLFNSIVAVVGCLFVIIDIIYFVGFDHKVLALKIVTIVLSVFILIGGSVGTYFIAKANGIVDSVLDNSAANAQKYENFSGAFVYYDRNNQFSSIDNLKGKKVGLLYETSNGISYIAKNVLNDAEVKCTYTEYSTNTELVQSLLDGAVDAIAITSAYRDIYSADRDENSPFARYLDNLVNLYDFNEQLKVDSNKRIKNISKEPFNVLLIGYSRTDLGSPVGLADSIIVASINPLTYTVSMMSIARDSFVPVSCYGGEYDKINSGRSTSRQCFIQTVEDFIGMDIDYYMELDYLGLVAIVNAIGGIHVNNPVDFELDGVFVPAGDDVFCDGIMALQFCRERHHMPNGDFDRQQHQKEVIIKVAEKFIKSKDINLCLKAMEKASSYMSTDLSLKQLTSIFNLLLNTKNYTGVDTFSLVDFQTLRMTGYGSLNYYNYAMRLPLWVYLIYQGSYDESISHINEVFGRYESIEQEGNFEFSLRSPYNRPLFYSLDYENKFLFEPDPMPPFWRTLVGMTVSEAMEWATENGVSLKVEYIDYDDPLYDESLEGLVREQSIRYGQLISDFSEGTIYVMGNGSIDEDKYVPNFVNHNYIKAIEWANKHKISYSIEYDEVVEGKVGDVIEQDPKAFTEVESVEKLKIKVKAGVFTIKFDANGHTIPLLPSDISVKTGDQSVEFTPLASINETDGTYAFAGWYTAQSGGTKVTSTSEVTGENGSSVTLYAHWNKLVNVIFNNEGNQTTLTTSESFPSNPTKIGYIFGGWFTGSDGSGTQYTSFEGITDNIELYAKWSECTSHEWGNETIITEPTCEATGKKQFTCTKCGATREEDIPALGHNYVPASEVAATCTESGYTGGQICERCGQEDPSNPRTSTPSLGHDYDPTTHKCTRCGEPDPTATP